jgi:hypothetical protein
MVHSSFQAVYPLVKRLVPFHDEVDPAKYLLMKHAAMPLRFLELLAEFLPERGGKCIRLLAKLLPESSFRSTYRSRDNLFDLSQGLSVHHILLDAGCQCKGAEVGNQSRLHVQLTASSHLRRKRVSERGKGAKGTFLEQASSVNRPDLIAVRVFSLAMMLQTIVV